ncbi:unnamed protein product [Ascophyllum nodosum]
MQPTDPFPQKSLVAADPTTFYIDAAFFAKLHARPSRASCSLGVRCGNSLAVIFCHNCARFDGGCGRFCKSCFQVYHPWYRMAHKWSPIGLHPDEPSEELHRQAYRANVGRNIADIQELLQKTSMWKNELRVQDADTKKADDLIREAVRNASRVAVKIR